MKLTHSAAERTGTCGGVAACLCVGELKNHLYRRCSRFTVQRRSKRKHKPSLGLSNDQNQSIALRVLKALILQRFPTTKVAEMSLTNGGRTTISIAAEKGDDPLLWSLIENDSSKVDLADVNGRTPLSFAAALGSVFGIEALIEHGANVDAHDKSGRTPLSWAAAGGHTAAARILLENKVEPESQDVQGKTPLIYACIEGHVDMVSLLIDWNQSLRIKKDINKMSALAHAAANGHNTAIEILLTKEAVVRDWALQGWKEKMLKGAAKAKAKEEKRWGLGEEKDWNLRNSKMPQTQALKFKHGESFRLLEIHWHALMLDSQAHPPPSAPSSSSPPPPMTNEPRRGRSLSRTAIGMKRKGVRSPQVPANPGENEPWQGRPA